MYLRRLNHRGVLLDRPLFRKDTVQHELIQGYIVIEFVAGLALERLVARRAVVV